MSIKIFTNYASPLNIPIWLGLGQNQEEQVLSSQTTLSKLEYGDYPITVDEATELSLPISVDLPPTIYNLMELYAQPQGRRPWVQCSTSRCPKNRVQLDQRVLPEQAKT